MKYHRIISLLVCSAVLIAMFIMSIRLLLLDVPLDGEVIACSCVGFIIGIGGCLYATYSLFASKKPAPVDWNEHCLVISYGFYYREVEWQHIKWFSVRRFQNMDWIVVRVDNGDDVIASTKNWLLRKSLNQTRKRFGGLYVIRATDLAISPQQLCTELTAELQRRKSRTHSNI